MLGNGNAIGQTVLYAARSKVPSWVPRNPDGGRPVLAYASIAKDRFWYKRVYPSFSTWMAALGLALGGAGFTRWDKGADGYFAAYAAGTPRLAYNDAGSKLGARFWSDAANLLSYSDDMANGYWFGGGVTITSDQATGPTGAQTLDLLTEGAGAAQFRPSSVLTTVSGKTYTVEAFVSRGNFDWLRIQLGDTTSFANWVNCWFNVGTGEVGVNTSSASGITFVSASGEAVAGGLYRIRLVCVINFTTAVMRFVSASANGASSGPDLGSGARIGTQYYLGGVQLRQSAVKGPPVFSAAGPASTPADYLTITPVVATGAPNVVFNGSFDANITGWTAAPPGTGAWNAGAARLTSNGTNQGRINQQATFEAGCVYCVEWDCLPTSQVNSYCFISTTTSGAQSITGTIGTSPASTGRFYFVATQASLYIILGCSQSTNGVYVDVDNVSVRKCTYLGLDKPVPAAGAMLGLRMASNEPTDGSSTVFGYPLILGTDNTNNRLNVRGPSGDRTPAAVLGDGVALDSFIPAGAPAKDAFFRWLLGTNPTGAPNSCLSVTGQTKVTLARGAAVDPASPGGFIGLNVNAIVDEILIDNAQWAENDQDAWVAAA